MYCYALQTDKQATRMLENAYTEESQCICWDITQLAYFAATSGMKDTFYSPLWRHEILQLLHSSGENNQIPRLEP
jgi:hypothetical protein